MHHFSYICVVRNIVENFTKGDSTSNLCAIVLSKAFDKINPHIAVGISTLSILPLEMYVGLLPVWAAILVGLIPVVGRCLNHSEPLSLNSW